MSGSAAAQPSAFGMLTLSPCALGWLVAGPLARHRRQRQKCLAGRSPLPQAVTEEANGSKHKE